MKYIRITFDKKNKIIIKSTIKKDEKLFLNFMEKRHLAYQTNNHLGILEDSFKEDLIKSDGDLSTFLFEISNAEPPKRTSLRLIKNGLNVGYSSKNREPVSGIYDAGSKYFLYSLFHHIGNRELIKSKYFEKGSHLFFKNYNYGDRMNEKMEALGYNIKTLKMRIKKLRL
jgi:hypothetical protein